MLIIKYVLLGIIQGMTEFLPVSSSAHLVIFQNMLQTGGDRLLINIILHLGSLAALIVFLFRDLRRLLNARILLYLLLATAVTAGIVLLSERILDKGFFENLFTSVQYIPFMLLITAAVLLFSRRFSRGGRRMEDLKIKDALWLGLAQGGAVIPGLSRSGLTICTMLFRRMEREEAFKFSFLAAIPAILGALVFKFDGFSQIAAMEARYIIFGFLSSFLSSLLALRILLAVIRKAQLHLFGYYCIALALILLAVGR